MYLAKNMAKKNSYDKNSWLWLLATYTELKKSTSAVREAYVSWHNGAPTLKILGIIEMLY